jgi:iron-sulfur cluster assembly protein
MTKAAAELPITISERAKEEVLAIMAGKSIPKGYGLRIGVRGGGCSGVSYIVGFDKPKEKDDVYDLGTFQVMIEKRHTLYVVGLEVDFVDTATERGFSFRHPEIENG